MPSGHVGAGARMISDDDRRSGGGAAGDALQVVLFRLAGRTFALPAGAVQEILPMMPLTDAAATPSFVQGYLDLGPQEEILPILRLDRLLHLPDGAARVPGLHTPIIVVRPDTPDARPFGLLAERVERLVRVPAGAVKDAGETFNGCITSLLTLSGDAAAAEGDVTAAALSVESLLLAEERERLTEFTAMAETRRLGLTAAIAPVGGSAT
jgi:purine-binding chemotaxis protein CheW